MAQKLFFIFFLGLLSFNGNATKITAVADGNWNQNGSWDDTHPGCYDTICIPAGITVTITATEDLFNDCSDTIIIIVDGRLEFQNGKKLKLPCGSDIYINSGGSMGVGSGGGSSTYVEICEDEYWTAADGDITGPGVLCGSGGCGGALPIELAAFSGELNIETRHVDLFWTTYSETENDYFTVFRSINGLDWVEVCEQDGAGTSSTPLSYEDADVSPNLGYNYYKLRQTDFNGISTYSDPILVINEGVNFSGELVIFGSGQNGLINIFLKDFKGESTVVTIYNLAGQIIYSQEIAVSSDGLVIVQLNNPIAGASYLVHVGAEIEKIISQ